MITFVFGVAMAVTILVLLNRYCSLGMNDMSKTELNLRDELRTTTLEFQALVLADDFYPEMSRRKNRLDQLRFEMLYIDNDFTQEWSSQERAEIAAVCNRVLKREAKDFVDNREPRPAAEPVGTKNFAERVDNSQRKRESWTPRIEFGEEVSHA